MLPMALSTATDARNALGRIRHVFAAEEVAEPYVIDPTAEKALVVKNASFAWETAPAPASEKKAVKEEKEKPKNNNGLGRWFKKKHVQPDEAELKNEGKKDEENSEEKKVGEKGVDEDETPATTVAEQPEQKQQQSLELRDIDFVVPRGQLCAIVGPGQFR
jgi:ATP-binding cassette subfamily C (CFTR/MRP) protein 1